MALQLTSTTGYCKLQEDCMGVYVSPGVYVREVDLSLYIPALSTTSVGMVGCSTKGPTNVRTYVTNQQQFIDTFGEPDDTVGYEAYAALQYLRRGRQLWFVRVVGDDAAAAEYTLQRLTAVADEVADDTPNGVLKVFTGTLAHFPVDPESLTFTATIGAAEVTATDDGNSVVTGTGVTGTINYTTGDFSLTYTTEPDDTTDIVADYSYLQDGAAIAAVSEGEWGNNISVTVAAGTVSGNKVTVFYNDAAVEKFDNVNLDDTSANYIETKINGISDFVTVTVDAAVAAASTELLDVVSTAVSLADGDTDATGVTATEIIGSAWDTGLGQPTGLYLFAASSAVDINLLCAPGWYDPAVVNKLIEICEDRADCMALIDPPDGLQPSEVVDWHNGTGTYNDHAAFNSSYAALQWSWVKVYDSYNGQYVYTPPSGHTLAIYAYTDQNAESWFAPAGFNRGRVISGIDVEYGPSRGEMDLLYGDGNAINPIIKHPKEGLVLWGQRTLQRAPTALDRVNVRRLLLYLRKVIATAAGYLVFEPNDSVTWKLFGHLVTPFLNDVRQRRGLYDFRVKCDETTNTPDVIDRNEMRAQIFLKPTKAAEFIQVDLVLTATGATFDEVLY